MFIADVLLLLLLLLLFLYNKRLLNSMYLPSKLQLLMAYCSTPIPHITFKEVVAMAGIPFSVARPQPTAILLGVREGNLLQPCT